MTEEAIQAFVDNKFGACFTIEDDRDKRDLLDAIREACEKERAALFAWLDEEYGNDSAPGAWKRAWEKAQGEG